MPHDGEHYSPEWIAVADKDIERARRLVDGCDPDLAGFCLQQAVEKYLKAYLLSKGWMLRKVHNLDALLDDAVSRDPIFEQYRAACQKITAFYMAERYPPFVSTGLTEEDVRQSLADVAGLVEKIRREMKIN